MNIVDKKPEKQNSESNSLPDIRNQDMIYASRVIFRNIMIIIFCCIYINSAAKYRYPAIGVDVWVLCIKNVIVRVFVGVTDRHFLITLGPAPSFKISTRCPFVQVFTLLWFTPCISYAIFGLKTVESHIGASAPASPCKTTRHAFFSNIFLNVYNIIKIII